MPVKKGLPLLFLSSMPLRHHAKRRASSTGARACIVFLCLIAAANVILPAPTTGRTIGGSVTGLIPGARISILKDGKDAITIATNGNFVFPTRSADTNAYEVSIQTQPDMLRCIIENGSGIVKGANVTNVRITCPMARRNSLIWMRCSYGQVWNASKGDCTGTGSANSYGAARLRYCPANDTSCNGGSSAGALNESSAIFTACDSLNANAGTYGIKTWRVPEKDELRSLVVCSDGTATPLNDYGTDPYRCGYKKPNYVNGSYKAPTIDMALFPNTISLEYWTATPAEKQASSAWYTGFQNGWTYTGVKSGQSYLRCVATP